MGRQSGLDEVMGVTPMMLLVALLNKEEKPKLAHWYLTKGCPQPHGGRARRRFSPDATTTLVHLPAFRTRSHVTTIYVLPKLWPGVIDAENSDTHPMHPFLLRQTAVPPSRHAVLFQPSPLLPKQERPCHLISPTVCVIPVSHSCTF